MPGTLRLGTPWFAPFDQVSGNVAWRSLYPGSYAPMGQMSSASSVAESSSDHRRFLCFHQLNRAQVDQIRPGVASLLRGSICRGVAVRASSRYRMGLTSIPRSG
jgi:hypothetical protein